MLKKTWFTDEKRCQLGGTTYADKLLTYPHFSGREIPTVEWLLHFVRSKFNNYGLMVVNLITTVLGVFKNTVHVAQRSIFVALHSKKCFIKKIKPVWKHTFGENRQSRKQFGAGSSITFFNVQSPRQRNTTPSYRGLLFKFWYLSSRCSCHKPILGIWQKNVTLPGTWNFSASDMKSCENGLFQVTNGFVVKNVFSNDFPKNFFLKKWDDNWNKI